MACAARMAAWSWYGPGRAMRSARASSSTAASIAAPSHRDRSWSGSRTSDPSGAKRASARARWSRMSASRPSTSGSSGMSRATSEVSHAASRASSRRSAASPDEAR